ncbi:dienelactone hydrolase family protein [Altererythrobacter sp. ZODW24]|uniref:dienelactone hydrolase family protein n=1 Tax=Altererythrobacter sp. ZODW24 TaxID=2185142 RepID=UPI000DF8698A|nr:dienelactone hydrolase family protein [Altererythrobacter sp. ZODW24]
MCDTFDLEEMTRKTNGWRDVNRRQFGAIGAVGAATTLAACSGVESASADDASGEASLTETPVSITTADGTMDAVLIHPASGKHPAVILWPDIASLRDAKKMMARRTAAEGYTVLIANPYYRDAPAPQFADFADFAGNGGWDKVTPWREKLNAEAIMRDTNSLVAWLDAQDSVDTAKGIGTEGYCMGGPFTVWSTAAEPTRVKAAASFHGGGLATDSEMSPHKLLGTATASYLIAVAQNDDAKDPVSKVTFGDAAKAAGRAAEVEVYAADHGWTVLDSPVYEKAEAERAYAAKVALYGAM